VSVIPTEVDELRRLLRPRLVSDDRLAAAARGGRAAMRPAVADVIRREAPLLPTARARELVEALLDDVAGLGPLERLLADPEVTEVMLNGPGRAFVERSGRLVPVDLAVERAELERLVERILTPLGLRCDRTSPIVDARLPDGSRVHAVVPPVAVDGPYLTIRRFGARSLPLDAFGGCAALRALLAWMVRAGWNLLVSGGTSSGKTTLLNALSALLPPDERIVTVEETAELRLAQPHVLALEARPANAEGVGAVDLRALVRASLRMRPDRIVVGEVRGPEALDMIEALNTGHDGSLSTIHANGPAEALLRLEALALRAAGGLPLPAVRAHIASCVDAVVHVSRSRSGRRIEAVAEVSQSGRRPGARVIGTPDGVVARPTRPLRRAGAGSPPPLGEG
jgi:pilus assembly protein CpaF